MNDGFDIVSWQNGESVNIRCADSWICPDGKAIKHIRWWGSYPGWENDREGPVEPPEQNAKGFTLGWYEYNEDSGHACPGELIADQYCEDFTEDWFGAVESRENPDEFEHEFQYGCDITEPWQQAEGVRYFLVIQAHFDKDQPDYKWGWLNSEFSGANPAVFQSDTRWLELSWPQGHRLAGESMSMAFELWTQMPPQPTATPTSTPTATPTASPTATPTPSPTGTPVVQADFYATPTLTLPRRPIRFMNTSSGDTDQWRWSFGDSGESELKHPLYFYQNPGVYSVTLWVSSPHGQDATTRQDYITILPIPEEQEIIDFLLGVAPLSLGDINRDGIIDIADLIDRIGK